MDGGLEPPGRRRAVASGRFAVFSRGSTSAMERWAGGRVVATLSFSVVAALDVPVGGLRGLLIRPAGPHLTA